MRDTLRLLGLFAAVMRDSESVSSSSLVVSTALEDVLSMPSDVCWTDSVWLSTPNLELGS